MENTITIKEATLSEAELLFHICRLAYSENFSHHWEEGGLPKYLDSAYSLAGITADLLHPAIKYFIAFENEEPVGFMKVKLHSTLPGYPSTEGLEIEKIYFRPQHQRKGIGKQLINEAIELAKKLNKDFIWLGAIDQNNNALEFYKKIGFVIFDKTRLEIPYFKEELKGMWRMVYDLTNFRVTKTV